MGKKKALYWQKIPESRCVRKETVDINVCITSSNGDRKTKQSVRKTSRLSSRKRK